MRIQLNSSCPDTLTDQIVRGIQRLADERRIRTGTRLPSIRQFATEHNVSNFTVVQAFDRLVASGYIESRQGAGFFVCKPAQPVKPVESGARRDKADDVLWLLRRQGREVHFRHLPGVGWVPRMWLATSGLDRAMRDVSRRGTGGYLSGYGDPLGFSALREVVCRRLADLGIEASADQILLTTGISGAIDLVGRCLIRPDDVVLVDDPGYFHIFGHMRALGATVQGVPWTETGPDLDALENLARSLQPRMFITTSIVHNPTGRSISQGTAFRLLRIAERYDFRVVEDDVDGACHPNPPPRLASLDQLDRVIYVNSFSKALSPRLRVGLVAANLDLIQDLTDLKILTQAGSSEIAEQMVHEVIVRGPYRKHRAKLMSSLQRDRDKSTRRLEAIGLGPVEDDTHGLFAWMGTSEVPDTTPLAEAAAERSMLLAPGAMFSPTMTPSEKMRLNVAFCQKDDTIRLLEELLNEQARRE